MKRTYQFSDHTLIEADKADLQQLLAQNQEYLENYTELQDDIDNSDYLVCGNGFRETKFSESFIEGQIEKYRRRIAEIQGWLDEIPSHHIK